jgi:hypothetical protein
MTMFFPFTLESATTAKREYAEGLRSNHRHVWRSLVRFLRVLRTFGEESDHRVKLYRPRLTRTCCSHRFSIARPSYVSWLTAETKSTCIAGRKATNTMGSSELAGAALRIASCKRRCGNCISATSLSSGARRTNYLRATHTGGRMGVRAKTKPTNKGVFQKDANLGVFKCTI